MRIEFAEIWATPNSLIIKVNVWPANKEWRVKKYLSVPLSDIPEEVLADLTAYAGDLVAEEDHHQTALF